MNIESIWEKWQTVLIAISPAIGYALAYVHELGYYHYFGIPTEIIKLDWTTILVAIASTAAGIALVSWFLAAIIMLKGKKLAFLIFTFLFCFFFAILYLTIQESGQLGVGFLAMIFAIYIIPWYMRTYQQNLVDEYKPVNDSDKNDAITKWLKDDKVKYVLLSLWVGLLVFSFSYLGGRSAAMRKSTFYIPSSNPQAVVLKINGNDLICAPLISGTHYFQQTYFVLKIDDPKLSITANQNLGYLRAFGKEY